MKYTLEIQKLLAQADSYGVSIKEQCRLYKQAIRIADENEDIEWAYEMRLDYLHLLSFSATNEELVSTFTKVLTTYIMYPDKFDEKDFLWMYKWVLSEMFSNPDVSLNEIERILIDFRVRLEHNGYSYRAYYDRLFDESLQMNRYDAAWNYLQIRNDEPRDDMSNCEACELDTEVDYYLARGEFEEAYNRAQPLISKQLTCRCVPTRTFATLAIEALLAGRNGIAMDMFARAEEGMLELSEDESMLGTVGMMTNYLLRTGNERAWEYMQKYVPWSIGAEAYRSYIYYKNLMGGLKHVNPAREVTLVLPPDVPYYTPTNIYKVETLYTYYKEEAFALAARFDARNRNTAFTDNVQKELE